MNRLNIVFVVFAMVCIGCGNGQRQKTEQEDLTAKKGLQGVWLDGDGEDVFFRIKGDSVYFPDSTSMPMRFIVRNDTFYLCGANRIAYPISKRTPHLFVFTNQNGEQIRLVKSDDKSYLHIFNRQNTTLSINQNRIVKRDTIVSFNDKRYHCYVQVNPTTYKVIKASYNDNGVEVDNVYYDNILHLSIFQEGNKVFSRNVLKREFSKVLSNEILSQTVFSDLSLNKIDKAGFHYIATLAIPDTMTSYLVEMVVSFNGKVSKYPIMK